MNSLRLFLTINRGKALWRRKTVGSVFATLLIALLFLSIGIGEYYGFSKYLKILEELPEIKTVILTYSLYSIFLLLFCLIIASILITGPFIYLNKKDTNFLLPYPIKDITLFEAHFLQQLFMSIWIILIFGIPVIFALNSIASSSFFLFNSLFYLIVLVILAVTFGNIFLLAIMSFTRKLSYKMNFFVIFLFLVLLVILITRTITPHDIFTLLAASDPNGNQTALNNLAQLYHLWPSGWYVNIILGDLGIFTSIQGEKILLILVAIILLLAEFIIAQLVYRPILQHALEDDVRIDNKKSYLTRFRGNLLFIFKEWISIIRNRRDFSQFVFFIFLLGIYVSIIFNTPALEKSPDPIWTPRVISFIAMVLCYFIILISLRFVFPTSSLEKDKSWYLLTLPGLREKNFSARIFAYFIPTIVIIELMIIATSFAFGLSHFFFWPLILTTPFIAFTIITLSETFGSFFPVKEKIEAESISTTPQGLALFVLVSLYVFVIVYALWSEAKVAVLQNYIGIHMGLSYWLVIIFSVLLAFVFWVVGKNKYKVLNQE